MQRGPNIAAARTPVQLLTGCGSFQRNSPVGASANGTPLKARTPVFCRPAPSTTPSAVLTRSGTAALIVTVAKTVAAAARSVSLTLSLIHVAPCLFIERFENTLTSSRRFNKSSTPRLKRVRGVNLTRLYQHYPRRNE